MKAVRNIDNFKFNANTKATEGNMFDRGIEDISTSGKISYIM